MPTIRTTIYDKLRMVLRKKAKAKKQVKKAYGKKSENQLLF